MLHVVVRDVSAWPSIPFDKMTISGFLSEMRQRPILAIDLKTTGLDPVEDTIKAVTIATSAGDIYVLHEEVIENNVLRECIDGKGLVVHSGLKDLSFIMYRSIHPASVIDTCLCDMVINNHVMDEDISYALPDVLKRYDIPGSFDAYQHGLFWREGFSVGGINYLTLFVRYLFDLKNKIFVKYSTCTNTFRMVNNDLMIAAQMNVSPIPISLEKLEERKEETLENACSIEASLYEMFVQLGDSPGKMKQEQMLPDSGEQLIPLFDVDNKKEIKAFLDRCECDPDLFAAYETGTIDDIPSEAMFSEYRQLVHKYNNLYRKIELSHDDSLLYSHYVPMSKGRLGIKCIKGFPRTTFAKKHKLPPGAPCYVDPYEVIIRGDSIVDVDESGYSMMLFEVFDLPTFAIGLLCGDRCAMRLALDKESELKMLKEQLEQEGVPISKHTHLGAFMSQVFRSGFLINNELLSYNGFTGGFNGKVVSVINKRYKKSVDTVAGLIERLMSTGDASIFSEYPIYWKNQPWVKTIKAKLTEDFWKTYQQHEEAKDDVYFEVQKYYKEVAKAQHFIRERFVDYAKNYVMSNLLYSVNTTIRSLESQDVIQFIACDDTSFVVMYPRVCEDIMNNIIETSLLQVERRLGEKLPITTTSI